MTQGVFGVNEGSFFDEVGHTQGGFPHLLQFLWDEYCAHLVRVLEDRAKAGKPAVTLEQAKKLAPATHFARWAADYLKENRVVENFFLDSNHGVRLANNKTLAICPGTEIRGTMQESGAIPVMEGRSQPGNNGVTDTPSLRI